MTSPADIPPPLPWDDRNPSVEPMAGGLSGYLNSLRELCQHVDGHDLSRQTLTRWIQNHFGYGYDQARKIENFLRRTGVITLEGNRLYLSDVARRWYETEDDSILIAQLHGQIQFFGEMLAEVDRVALSIEEILSVASDYGVNWGSRAQVDRRRGWLQSAGMIKPSNGGRLTITDAGRHLLSQLDVHQPLVETSPTNANSTLKSENLGGSVYVSPTRHEPTESKRVFEVDPDLVDRGTTAHMDVQDQLAEAVQSAGLEPRSPASHDPQFDVAWKMGNSAFVAEVKSLTEENEERQLRLGLGQVLSYAHLLKWPGVEDVRPVLAVERRPAAEYWSALCKEHGVILTWPDEFKDIFG